MWSVRGIGVALSASTSTSSRSWRSSSFCATPKRCSSSTTTMPSSFGITSRERTRCVPIRTSTLPSLKSGEHLLHVGRLAEARHHLDADGEVAVAVAEGVPVLLREHRRRHEHQHLLAVDGDRERGAHRHLGLAEADVAADEPVHRMRRLEILHHRLDRRPLVLRLAVRELRLEALDPLVLDVVGDARLRLPLRVQLQQLAGHLAQVCARTSLQVVPRLAAELRERGRLRVGADVAADLADLLVRDVDAVVAAVGEQQVVARDARNLLRLEALQLRDAVVLVDDVVARAQVGEALQRAARRSRGARRPLAEDLRVGQQRDAEVAPDEAAPRGRDGEREARRVPRPARAGARVPRRSSACWRSASPRCGNATTMSSSCRSRPFSSFSASESPRAAIAGRCASKENGWPCGSGASSVAPARSIGAKPSSAHTAAHLVGRPDEVGRALERRHEVGRDVDVRRRPRARRPAASSSTSSRRRSAAGIDGRRRRPARSARCVNGEKARICSISSPKSSMRSGSRPVVGKTSTRPPRTANCPRSSTRSTRS